MSGKSNDPNKTVIGSVTVPNNHNVLNNIPLMVDQGGAVHVDLAGNVDFQNLVTMVKMMHERLERLEKAEKDLLKRVQKAVRLKQVLLQDGSE
jgi:hypothetical protein